MIGSADGPVRHGFRALCRPILATLLGTAAVIVVAGYGYGIPGPLVGPILRRGGPARYALQADRMRLRGAGARLDGVRLYRKGIPGLPGVEARQVDITLSPLRWLAGYDGVGHVRLTGAVCRPEQLFKERKRVVEHPGRPSRFTFELVDSSIARVRVDHCTGTVLAGREAIEIDPFHARYAPQPSAGFASGALRYDRASGQIAGGVVLQHNPYRLMPIIEGHALTALQRLIEMFEFTDALPRLDAVFHYDPDAHEVHVDGEFRLRDFQFRGVPSLRADGAVVLQHSATNTRVSIDRLFMQRTEGQASGRLSADRAREQVVFDIRSTLHPPALAAMTGVAESFLRRRFTFNGPVSAWFVGYADYGTLAGTAFRARVQAEDGSALDFPFDRLVFDAVMTGRTLRLPMLTAELLEGRLNGWFECEVPAPDALDEPIPFALAVSLRDLDFRRSLNILKGSDEGEAHGRINGELELTGRVDDDLDWGSLNGRGALAVHRGRVFMLPLFGGLSRLMTTIIPGLDFVLRQSDARAAFDVEDGRVKLERMMIDGDILSLSARGSVLLPDRLDLDVQVRLLKEHTLVARLLRVITYPISKLFEFRVAGTVSDPVWYPVNFSADLLERLGGGRSEAEVE